MMCLFVSLCSLTLSLIIIIMICSTTRPVYTFTHLNMEEDVYNDVFERGERGGGRRGLQVLEQ